MNYRFAFEVFYCTFLMITSAQSVGDTTYRLPNKFLSLGYDEIKLEPKFYQSQNIQNTIPGFSITYSERFSQYVMASAGVTFYSIDPLINTTTDESFDETSEHHGDSTEFHGTSYQAEIGPIYGSAQMTFGLALGYRQFQIEKSYENCSDCESQNITLLEENFYLRPQIGYQFTSTLGASLSYMHYFSGSSFSNDNIAKHLRLDLHLGYKKPPRF